MIHLTSNLRNKLIEDKAVGLAFTKILNHINECAKYLVNASEEGENMQLLKEFSIWYISSLDNVINVFAIADTNEPITFMQCFEGTVPKMKLYLADNGESGYTLMLPEDY